MKNFPNKIQTSFSKASKSYDNVAKIQRQAAKYLVNKLLELKNFDPKTILDLGTGTGYIPELLLKKYSQSSYYLNDISNEMLKICKAKFSRYLSVNYLHSDMIKLNVSNFDLCISNLALQWVDNLWDILKAIYVKSSQVFAFSTLLEGTFKEWENIVNKYQNIKLHSYPQALELINFCTKLNDINTFDYWIMDIPISFDNCLTFMHYLKLLGASASNRQMHLSNLKVLLMRENDNLIVTYKIFFGIFKKV